MKMKRTLCLILVFALAFMLPVSSPVEAKKAKKAKKKTVELSKKKLDLAVGQKKKVTVKNAKAKKVTWSVDKKAKKKKIVKLSKKSNKGVTIKGAKQGKATVTAKIKVGKKTYKKSVKVTVKKKADNNKKKTPTAITISSVSVLNSRTVQVSLSAAQALSDSNFTVKSKVYETGSYNRTLKIDRVSTSDKRTYMLTLDSESSISENQFVQVTVQGLQGSGTLSKETVYSKGAFNYTYDSSEYIYTDMVNDSVDRRLYDDGLGYCTYSVSGLPDGISSKVSDSGTYVRFTGKPTRAGTFHGKVVAKDELGNSYTYNITWLVGSENTIAAACAPIYGITNTDGKYYVDKKVYAIGGSGWYDYEIQGNAQGLEMSGSWLEGDLPAAGEYGITVQVTDSDNESIKTTAVLSASIKEGRTISGVIKDARGNALPYADVRFENTDKANRYITSDYAYADSKGAYSIRLADGTYESYAYGYYAEGDVVTVQVSGTRSGVDYTLPVYPITVTTNNANVDASDFGYWYDDDDNEYGSGNKLYLKAGTYILSSAYYDGETYYIGHINATVTSSTTTVMATVTIDD
ncbi:MAG: carboxypeptidase regulatory-like domain-containing protein [Lachnospiraceae bacterium]|nr:carboxypeptidase regulatory-like domain-containing protein [Lachnospiraceae bacterium]